MTVWAYGRSHRNEYVPANGRFRLIWKLAIWASSCARPTAKIQSRPYPIDTMDAGLYLPTLIKASRTSSVVLIL